MRGRGRERRREAGWREGGRQRHSEHEIGGLGEMSFLFCGISEINGLAYILPKGN